LDIVTFMVVVSGLACGKVGSPWPSYWEGHAIRGKREMGEFPKHFRFVECDVQAEKNAALTRNVLVFSRLL
jgi:hypothetical protein